MSKEEAKDMLDENVERMMPTSLVERRAFMKLPMEVYGEKASKVTYIQKPSGRGPDFEVTSVNYKLEELLVKGGPTR